MRTSNIDLELEIIEAGSKYTLYACSLVNLASTLNEANDPTNDLKDVAECAKELRDSLFRCKVDVDIRDSFDDSDKIKRLLEDQELMLDICNHLTRQHQRRHELIFLLTCLVSNALVGIGRGIPNETTQPARTQAIRIGHELNVPESIVNQCFADERLTPLRQHFRSISWSEVIEAKPGAWGISFDIKKLFAFFQELMRRK